MKSVKKERDARVSICKVKPTLNKARVTASIQDVLQKLDRSIVATPDSFVTLEEFARANGGNMDMLLVHQAVQYGMKIALQNLADDLGVETSK